MNITFKQLKLFKALADTGSVTAAARMMHITQPTASMQLKELANAVGKPLFEIIAKKIYLTALGSELASTARLISSEWECFEQHVSGIKGLTTGNLKIAVVSTAKYFIPKMLGSFCEKYPDIDIALEVLNRDGVIKRLEQNMDDMYIMSMPPLNIEIDDEIFMANPLVIIAAKQHPLSNKKSIELNELKNERFILREIGSGTRTASAIQFKSKKFVPNIRLELGSNESIKQSVAAGLGLGLISMHALNDYPYLEDISILNINDFPIHSSWHIVTSTGKKLSPIAKIFHDHLLTEAKKLTIA
jgi:DNA-binding transcriptional LysR family regulator